MGDFHRAKNFCCIIGKPIRASGFENILAASKLNGSNQTEGTQSSNRLRSRAERNSNWQLHLQTFEQMLFYDRTFDNEKYFKWETIYLIDMKRLPTTHADLHDAFMNGFQSVSCN